MPEPIEVQYHNCSFVHLLMQKQSGNDVKETKVAANQEKMFKKERQNNSKGATKFISCSAPDLKFDLVLVAATSKLVDSCNNQSKDAPDCSRPRSLPISYLFRRWGRHRHYISLQGSCASVLVPSVVFDNITSDRVGFIASLTPVEITNLHSTKTIHLVQREHISNMTQSPNICMALRLNENYNSIK